MSNISIYLGESSEGAAKEKVIRTLIDVEALGSGVRLYKSFKELVRDIADKLINREEIGQILNASSRDKLDGIIRHDLKNLPEISYEEAYSAEFSYSECPNSQSVPEILAFIHNAVNSVLSSEKLEAEAEEPMPSINELKSQMEVPSREVVIVIVDDTPQEIEGMEAILSRWENIVIRKVLVDFKMVKERLDSGIMPSIPDGDIVLLDEQMDRDKENGVTGTNMFNEYLEDRKNTIVVSTTSGMKPDWASRHIERKRKIGSNKEETEAFIAQINSLLPKG